MSKKPLEDLSLEEIEHIIGKQIPFGKIYDVGYDLIQKYDETYIIWHNYW